MKKLYISIFMSCLLYTSSFAQTVIPIGDELVVPQYAYYGATQASRVQVAVLLKLSGLTANTGYRYCTGLSSYATTPQNTATPPADTFVPGQFFTIRNTPASSTYGNIDGMAWAKGLNGNIIQSNIVNLTFSGPIYAGGFTSLSDGTYTGWFALATLGTALQQVVGSNAYFYVQLGLNASGSQTYLPTLSYRTTSTIKLLDYNTTSGSTSGITALVGTSNAPAEKFVSVYDNTSLTGRPLYTSWTEDDGLTMTSAFTSTGWYSTNVATNAGSWGAIIPNNLASGVQGIKYTNIDGTEYGHATSADGSWSSVSTVNPAGGSTTPIVINATPTTVLPITLTSFTSQANSSGINLNWKTAQEINNQYFEIQRAGEDKKFDMIGKVNGAINSTEAKSYSYTDFNPLKGNNYYQLKQYDLDGKSSVYGPVAVKFGLFDDSFSVLSSSETLVTVNVSSSIAKEGILSYIGLDGRVLYKQTVAVKSGLNTFNIPVNKTEGQIAILTFTSNGQQKSLKIAR